MADNEMFNTVAEFEGGDYKPHLVNTGDISIKISAPVNAGPVSTSSGAGCRITRPADVFLMGDSDHPSVVVDSIGKEPGSKATDDLTVTDNAAGVWGNLPVNSSTITYVEEAPLQYVITDAWNWTIGLPGYRDEQLRLNDPTHRAYLENAFGVTLKDHATILDKLGIECRKDGLKVSPVLSVDDVKSMALSALGKRIETDEREK